MQKQKKRIHLIANAHLDPVWQWPWEEGLGEALATFRIAVDFCESYKDFQFTHNESLLYAWVEEFDPPLFGRIQELVRKGKWNIAGGAFLQPDLNGPCGESHIRQFLIGLNYFKDRFGKRPRCAYNFDPFGQPEGLAQILRGCGMSYYIFCRPGRGSYDLPVGAFHWKDRSGSAVLGRRSDDHYNSNNDLGEKLQNFTDHYRGEAVSMLLWGLGNHGGGPSRAQYAVIGEFFAAHNDLECVHSNPETFFSELIQASASRAAFPEVTGEIQDCFPGCYSSMNRLKTRHRSVEGFYYSIEALSAFRWWTDGADYPSAVLSSALKDILFCEFHDILPGSGTPTVETDSNAALFRAEEMLKRLRMKLLMPLITGSPKTAEGEIPVFVFNNNTVPYDGAAELELSLDYAPLGRESAVIEVLRSGNPIPFQRIKAEHNLMIEWRPRLAVQLQLEPWEITRLTVRYRCGSKGKKPAACNAGGAVQMENRRLEIRISAETGLIDSVSVKETGTELFEPGAFLPVVLDDLSHSWTCGDPAQFRFGGEVSRSPAWKSYTAAFRLAAEEELAELSPVTLDGWKPVRIIEDGPVLTRVEAVFVYRRSYIIRSYTAEKNGDLFEIRDRVFFGEKDMMLKNSAELKCCYDYSLSETPYSAVRRNPDSEWKEHHNQRWTAVCGNDGSAVLIVNDASFAHSFCGRTYAPTILRSPTYTSFGISADDPWQAGRWLPRQGQGMHECGFRIYYHPRFSESAASAAADIMNRRPFSLPFFPDGPAAAETGSGGSRADSGAAETMHPGGWIRVDRPEIRIEAVKKAEKEETLIIRLRNTESAEIEAAVEIAGLSRTVSLRFGAYRIKTVAVSKMDYSVREVNMVEEDE